MVDLLLLRDLIDKSGHPTLAEVRAAGVTKTLAQAVAQVNVWLERIENA